VAETEDGKILLHDFGGCALDEICDALGIKPSDLFPDSDLNPSQRRTLPPRPKRLDWRQFANAVQHLSDTMYLRSERIFSEAHGLTPSQWTDSELDSAMRVIAKAYYFREQSERLADFAVAYRAKHLAEEYNNAHRSPTAA
jgi:hypothetical protein